MEITSYVNDRPLTTITEDPNDLEPLTPNMFLRGTKNASFPEEEEITDKKLQGEWQRMNKFKETLQSRFRREYLGQLVEHSKTSTSSKIEVGDIVLVGADNKKRHAWPMARVIEIIAGTDNEIRTAKVKTKYGCLIRPLQRLYPLEMSKSDSKPKDIPVQAKCQDKSKTETEIVMAKNQLEEDETTTRSGRRTRKPIRYGWNV